MAKLIIGDKTFEGTVEEIKALMAEGYEPSEPTLRKIDVSEAQAGDYVKFAEDPNDYIIAGKMYKITEIDGDPLIIDEDGDIFDTACETFEVFTQREAEAKVTPALKVGDYAKIRESDTFSLWHYEVGEIVKVVKFRDDGYVFVEAGGKRVEHMHPSQVTRATDEEVAKAKVEAKAEAERQAEEAKWAKIGRKPNEFKKGDIVQVTKDRALGSRNMAGDIGEITEKRKHNFIVNVTGRTGTAGNAHTKSSVELITPVEARFDRQ